MNVCVGGERGFGVADMASSSALIPPLKTYLQ